MKKISTTKLLVILLVLLTGKLSAQKPWKCDGRAIGTYNPGSNSYFDDTKLYSAIFDALGNVTYLDKPATTAIGLNAIGFRKQDGFVYGVRYTNGDSKSNELCRIDSTGIIDVLGQITNIKNNVQYYAGAFDVNGYLYVSAGSGSSPYKIYKIDVATKKAVDSSTTTYRLIDMAFDPLSNELYATSSNISSNGGDLLKINFSTSPATVTSLGTMNVFMFGLFFTDGAQLYGFGRAAVDNTTAYYKLNKVNGTVINAGDGPSATNADACSCPFRLSHTLQGKFNCLNVGEDTTLTVAITNITTSAQSTTFDLTMDKRFKFTETALQIQQNIQSAFLGSTANVTISSADGGTNNVISINTITVPVTTLINAPSVFKLAIKAKPAAFNAGEQILFQSVIDVPGNILNLGKDFSDDPLTPQLDDATTLTVCMPEGGPLPVTITDFSGRLNDGVTNLSWRTNHEINTKRFEVERSFNGINFDKLNAVAATGNDLANAYQYSDVNVPANTIMYYRLKIIENDGSFKYTAIVVLRSAGAVNPTTIYPSPFKDKLSVNTYADKKGKVTITITDAIGRTIYQKNSEVEAGNNTIILNDVTKLQEGLYFVKIYDNNNKLVQAKKTLKL